MPPTPDWWVSTELLPEREAVPFNAGGPRDYVRRYQVIMTNKFHDPLLACAAPYIPRPYAMYITETGYDTNALVVHISAQHREDAEMLAIYIVTVKWSTEIPTNGIPENFGMPSSGGQQSGGPENNPELEPPDIDWDYEEVKRSGMTDLDGNPMTNSALMPFNPPIPIEGCRPILVYTRNDKSFDGIKAATYANTFNTDTIGGRLPGTLLNLAPKAKLMQKGPIRYARVTYRIKFGMEIGTRKETVQTPNGPQIRDVPEYESFHFHKELDQGFCEMLPLLDANGQHIFEVITPDPAFPLLTIKLFKYKWVNMKDAKNQPTNKPMLLDGSGQQLKIEQNNLGLPKLQTPVYRSFRIRRGVKFSDFITRGF